MKNVQNRYQFIIGFVAVIISLSAFKDELKGYSIDLGFTTISASKYLFALVLAFIGAAYIYLVPYVLSTTRFANSKFLNTLESVSYGIFTIILLSPFAIPPIYVFKLVISKVPNLDENQSKLAISAFTAVASSIITLLSKQLINKFISILNSTEQERLEVVEISAIETAKSLFRNGFYAQSLMESFKAVESILFKTLRQRNLIFRQGNFQQILEISSKYGILTNEELSTVKALRHKRNNTAHSISQDISKEDANDAIQFTTKFVQRMENGGKAVDKSTEQYSNSEGVTHHQGIDTTRFFKGAVQSNIAVAKAKSLEDGKPVFLVIYDEGSTTKSKLNHSLGYFTEYETTKNLIHDNFIQVLADKSSPGIETYIPIDNPLENCLLVIIAPTGEIMLRESVYANPEEGLKRVRNILELWARKKS